MLTSKKLKEIEDLAKKVIKLLENSICGDEPLPIDFLLKYHRIYKQREDKFDKENDMESMNAKQISKMNIKAIDNIHKFFIETMDNLCDIYAHKYGNECNLQ